MSRWAERSARLQGPARPVSRETLAAEPIVAIDQDRIRTRLRRFGSNCKLRVGGPNRVQLLHMLRLTGPAKPPALATPTIDARDRMWE